MSHTLCWARGAWMPGSASWGGSGCERGRCTRETGNDIRVVRQWYALALKCHYVSLDIRAFPEKNRDVQIGEADIWMCIDAEKCPHWKMTTLNFHSLIECQSSLGELLFLYLELFRCAEIHTYAWKANVGKTKLQKFFRWTIHRTTVHINFIHTPMILLFSYIIWLTK